MFINGKRLKPQAVSLLQHERATTGGGALRSDTWPICWSYLQFPPPEKGSEGMLVSSTISSTIVLTTK